MTFGCKTTESFGSIKGSTSKTSNAKRPGRPVLKLVSNAPLSTKPERDVFTKVAVGFIADKSALVITSRVVGLSRT